MRRNTWGAQAAGLSFPAARREHRASFRLRYVFDVGRGVFAAGLWRVWHAHFPDVPGGPHAFVAVASGVVSLATESSLPAAFALAQNRPNPFSNSTLIQYALPRDTEVTLDVFDLTGHRVARLANGRETAGRHEVRFGLGAHDVAGAALGRVPAGVYFYRLQAGAQSATRKMLFVQ